MFLACFEFCVLLVDSVFKSDERDGIKDISIDCFGRKSRLIDCTF